MKRYKAVKRYTKWWKRPAGVCFHGFSVLARFQTYYGACFLKNLDARESRKVRTNESKIYFAYHWFVWFLGFTTTLIVGLLIRTVLPNLSSRGKVHLMLLGFFAWSTSLEAFVNSFLMKRNRSRWVDILARCERIEEEIHANHAMARRMIASSNAITVLHAGIVIFNLLLNILNNFSLGIIHHEKAYEDINDVEYYAVVFCSVLLGFLIPSSSTVCRVWMMYFGKLFEIYLKRINDEIREVFERRDSKVSEKMDVCDRMRISLNRVREVADMVSNQIGFAIFYGYGYSIPLLSIAGYFMTNPSMNTLVRVKYVMFAIVHLLSILVPTAISTSCSSAIENLKRTIEAATIHDSEPEFMTLLGLLDRAAVNDDYRIDALGFFKVDLPMFTSIAGAVVTYTVMMAQMNVQLYTSQIRARNSTALVPVNLATNTTTKPPLATNSKRTKTSARTGKTTKKPGFWWRLV